MSKSPRSIPQTTTTPPRSTTSAVVILALTVADTTWRAFVPTLGGTFLGIGLDNLTHLAPLFTIALIIVGFVVSGILIAMQIRTINRSNRNQQ